MPTIRRCCIVGCMSNSRLNPNLQFFQFPRPENPFYKLWTQACQASLSRILPFKKPVLCALHFHPHCIGGRRLTSSAIPSLKLEVPTNLKAVEQQAMVEEIERSRKCAYINAVVYEWLVRANLNPQLRGSITHGMIKDKAESAKLIIGCDTFMADNRWLNRFRESHLAGFSQKLAANQLKPIGPSLWIPDIVQDLQHLFPPTNADRVENFENVPEQYISYMKQYGEYEEDDDSEQDRSSSSNGFSEQDNGYGNNKMTAQSYFQQQQQQQNQHNYYQQHRGSPPAPAPSHNQQMSAPPPHVASGYNPYGHHPGYNAYHDYYNDRSPPPPHTYASGAYNGHLSGMLPHTAMPPLHQQQPPLHQQQPPLRPLSQHSPIPVMRPLSHSPMTRSPPQREQASPPQREQASPPQREQASPVQSRPQSHSPPQLDQQSDQRFSPPRPVSPLSETNGIHAMQNERSPSTSPKKRRYSEENGENDNGSNSKRSSPIQNGVKSRTPSPTNNNESQNNNNDNSFKIKLPLLNGKNSQTVSASAPNSPTPSAKSNLTHDSNSRSSSPKLQDDNKVATEKTNGFKVPSPAPSLNTKDIESYAQALEYLKPLEDFALFKENFRAIGLISQLENILSKRSRKNKEIKK